MMNGATWEEEAIARLRYAQEQRRQAEQEAAYWIQYTDALEKVLELERQRRAISVNGEHSVDLEVLRKKSVREALIEIAGQNNGLLICNNALDTLLRAGIFQDRDQGRNAIYSALHSAKADFHKERPGIYRLTDRVQPQASLIP
jgi:hypothetical protein